ncbi:DEAD (Asp-Glu-Ala-Asp) box polypeptide, putative [Ixodes scapularis]|uniref:DEAD (Asp-Glu-Ala-Asp) box polypeptide, putative n=1 Tax=Ixodes scapularis TaxID=6945 RepID=B7P3I4_IXOSC|nr:DEAD (Asp-Glu-Ala-Asp) box polypeptide, putative [Ixodes scapularis]|eukprot:XP_002404262.1 DEAD (Asp-Glu-Ala-Asp) box polypeptide, putative [Ixodes scapularis]
MVQFYGRRYFEGINFKAQKKEQSKFYGELLKRTWTQAEKDQEALRLKRVKRKEKQIEDDRHWSQESLEEMREQIGPSSRKTSILPSRGAAPPNRFADGTSHTVPSAVGQLVAVDTLIV